MANEIKMDPNLVIKEPEPHTITFHADEFTIGADRVCVAFEDIPFTLETIKTLVFKNMKGDKVFTYEKKD